MKPVPFQLRHDPSTPAPTPAFTRRSGAPPSRPHRAGWAAAALLCLAAACASARAQCVVTSLADDGSAGTLRSQIANCTTGTITFQSGLTGTITLSSASGPLVFDNTNNSSTMTVTGPGASSLAISGGNAVEVLDVQAGFTVTLTGLTIEDGLAAQTPAVLTDWTASGIGGGGVWNDGTLTLSGVVVNANTTPTGVGGGLYNSSTGTLTLASCTVSANTAGADGGARGNGGGLFSAGTLTVSASTFSGNTAGGGGIGSAIYNLGSATLTNSTVSGNTSTDSDSAGGAMGAIYSDGALSTVNVTVSGNTVTGASSALAGAGGGVLQSVASSASPANGTAGLLTAAPSVSISSIGTAGSQTPGGVITVTPCMDIAYAEGSDSTLTNTALPTAGDCQPGAATWTPVEPNILPECASSTCSFLDDVTSTSTTTPFSSYQVVQVNAYENQPVWFLITFTGANPYTPYLMDCNAGGGQFYSPGTNYEQSQGISATNGSISDFSTVSEYTKTTALQCISFYDGPDDTLSLSSKVDSKGYYIKYVPPTNTIGQNVARLDVLIETQPDETQYPIQIYVINILPSPGGGSVGNTILAGNTAASFPDAAGVFTDSGGNLIGTAGSAAGNAGFTTSTLLGTAADPLDAMLMPLGSYGGTTETMLSIPGSPAQAGGNINLIGSLTTDQRGQPRTVNGTVDVGADEFQGATLTASGGTPQSAYAGSAFATPLTVTAEETTTGAPLDGAVVAFSAPGSGASATLSTTSATVGADGTASVTATANATPGGPYDVTASLDGAAAQFALTNLALTPTTLTPAATPSATFVYNQQPAISATVSPADATGTLTATLDTTTTLTVTPESGGNFSIALPGTLLPVGSHSIAFTFTGSGAYASSTATLALQVNAPNYVVNTAADNTTGSCTALASTTSNTTDESGGMGTCTLRAALAAAGTAGAGNIYFDTTVFAAGNLSETPNPNIITLGSAGTLHIPSQTAIYGATSGSGASLENLVTVDGGSGSNGEFSDFTVGMGVTGAVLDNLTITDAHNPTTASYANGGGISNSGSLTVNDCSIVRNTGYAGGGIGNGTNANASGTLTVTGSTFSGNKATGGGGALINYGSATATVTDSTFAGNSASTSSGPGLGGAIWNDNALTLNDDTISGNAAQGGQGGGIYNDLSGAGLVLGNSIVSGNGIGTVGSISSPDDLDDNSGSSTFNAAAGNNGGDQMGYYNDAPVNTGALELAPLGNYGGPTETMLPEPESEAICAGSSSAAQSAGITADQRGVALNAGGYCASGSVDAGAVQTDYALSWSTEPGPVLLNTAMNPAPVVTLDEDGMPFTAESETIPLTLASNPAGAVLTGGSAATNSGAATYSGLSVSATGTGDTLTASLTLNSSITPTPPAVSATSQGFPVDSGPLTHFVITGSNPVPFYTNFNITVTAEDAGGNTDVSFNGTVTLSSSDPGFVATGGNPVTLVNGTATVEIALKTAGVDSVTATDSADSSITGTADFTVNPGPATQFSVSAPATAYLGGAVSVTVTAQDLYGNVATAYTGTVGFTSTDAQATLPASYTFTGTDAGVHTFTVTFGTVGSQTVTATDTVTSSITGTSAGTMVSIPGFVVNEAGDDTGNANNCSVQPTAGTTTNSDTCYLRDALAAAGAAGSGAITFDSTVFASAQTIALGNTGTLNIPANTTIQGATAVISGTQTNLVTVDGGSGSNGTFSIFTVGSSTTIANLNLAHGHASDGGGIDTNGGDLTLTLANCTFTDNFASTNGGAIYTNGAATVIGSTFTGNSAGAEGGAIMLGGVLTVSSSTFSGNSAEAGGAINLSSGGSSQSAAVSDSTFSGNSATVGDGGALAVGPFNTLTSSNNIFVGNTAKVQGAGVWNTGTTNAGNNVYYQNLDNSTTEDDCHSCTSNTNPISGNPELASLGSYGGPTETLLPLPGSAAICAGSSSLVPNGTTTDQRGVAFSAGGYCAAGSVDAGAVQTDYALSWSTEPEPIAPATEIVQEADFAAAVTLDENGNPFTAESETIPLTLTGAGALTGGSASTSAGVASYSSLLVSAAGNPDTLTASLPLNSVLSLTLTVNSNPFNVLSDLPTVTGISPAAGPAAGNTPITITGTNFTGATQVEIGGVPVTFTYISSTTLDTSTPAGTGTVDVTVTTPYGTSATSAADEFTWYSPLTAAQAIPSETLTAGAAANFIPVTGVNGLQPYSYAITSGTLPAGLSIDSTSGTIYGTPMALVTNAGFTVTVTDSAGEMASASFTLTVTAPNYVVNTTRDLSYGTGSGHGSCTPLTTTNSNTTDESGGAGICSLRAALTEAGNVGGANIYFDSTNVFLAPSTITLGSAGTLNIPSNTAIQGATTGSGATLTNLVTVNGNNGTRVFTVNSGVTNAAIASLTIANGSANGNGGGIDNTGTLTVTGSIISGSSASNSGGGIANTGTLTIEDSTVSGNPVGGGVYNDSTGTLTIEDSTLSGNTAEFGSGILNISGPVTIEDSTISGNTASVSGGGIYNYGALTITGSTVSGNTAGSTGGGIYLDNGSATLANSILAGNTDHDGYPDGLGVFTDGGYNLIGNGNGTLGISNGAHGDRVGSPGSVISPHLAPLANYGGTTQTMLPLPGSAAICAGSYSVAQTAGMSSDQRGVAFGNTGAGGYCESGSIDTGAVQTDYALTFAGNEPGASQVSGVAFTAGVTLTENGVAMSGVSIPVTASAGTLTGSPVSATTNASGLAGYSLTLNSETTLSDVTLTATLPAPPTLTATSSQFGMIPPPPTVTGISPSTGPTSGVTVTITGANLTSATAVEFGSVPAASFMVNNATQITAQSPPGAPGTVDVIVTTAGGTSTTSAADEFTWVTPMATSLTPTVTPGTTFVYSQQPAISVALNGASATTIPASDLTATLDTSTPLTVTAGTGTNVFDIALPATPLTVGSHSIAVSFNGVLTGAPPYYEASTAAISLTVTTPSFVVNSSGDTGAGASDCAANPTGSGPGSCTLRDALAAAQSAGAGNIAFDTTVFASATTITLTSGALTVPANTTLAGTGTSLLTIDGHQNGNIFEIAAGVTASVSNMTLQNALGTGSQLGGAVYNDGTLSMSGVTVKNSQPSQYSGGAGIYNDATGNLTLTDCTVANNVSSYFGGSSGYGGGLYNNGGTVQITACTFTGGAASEAGGNVYTSGGTVTIANSTITGSAGTQSGGGLAVGGGAVTVTDSTIAFNGAITSPGVLISGGSVTVTNSIVAGNGSAASTGNCTGCTLSGNNIIDVNPQLAVLGSYGGPTQTLVPLVGSPAICAGAATAYATDQRGYARPSGSCYDIGAVQTQYAMAFVQQPGNAVVGAAIAPPVTVTVLDHGNGIPGSSVNLTFNGSGSLGGTIPETTDATGTATFADLTVSATGANDTLTASAGTLSATSSAFTVNQAAVTASVTAASKTYDGTTAATITGCTLAGVAPADAGNVTCSASGATFATKNAGSGITVTATGITLGGSAASNYTLSPTSATTTANITAAPLTITAAANTKTYDATTSAAAVPMVGTGQLQGSDTVTGLAEVYSSASAGTGKTLNVSAYTVNDGNGGNNYQVTTVANTTGVINPVGVTASVTASNKTYNGTTAATVSCALTGVLPADTNNVTCSATGATFASGSVGTGITVMATGITLGGSAAGNYALSSTTATATASITAAPLSIAANNATRIYGAANPAFTGTVTGQQNGDTFTESFATTATISSPVGSYAIVPSVTGTNLADYTQTATNGTLTVTQAASAISLSASNTSITPGQSVTLTATVTDASLGSTGTPTGTVSFYDNGTLLNTAPVALSGGAASYVTTALGASSSNSITAVYSGDTNFTASSSTASGAVSITAASLDFTMTLTGPSNLTLVPGQSVSFQVQVAPDYGSYAGTVNFAIAGLPAGATASFSPSSIAANGGPQTVTITITAPPATAALHRNQGPGPRGRRVAPFALAFLLLFGAGSLRRRGRILSGLLSVLVLAGAGLAATTLSGCGGSGGFFAQSQQNYVVTITATAGNLQHSTTITLNVQ